MPTSNARVAIELYVDDKGTVRIREFSDTAGKSLDEVEKKSQSVTDRIKTGWNGVKSAWVEITAGLLAMRQAWNMMNMAAKAEQEKQAFSSLAQSYGRGADEIVAALKRASGETISTMDLIRSSGTAMMMGIDPDTVVKLMEVARATAKMTGQDVSKAFGDISLAVGRQSRMILDNLGIIVDVGKANEEYAASLGKTAAELSDAERKQAFLNATLQGGQDLMTKLGDQADTNADRLQRWAATIDDLKVKIGDGLNRALMGLLGITYTVEAGIMQLVEVEMRAVAGFAKITDWLHITSGAAQEWEINAEAASEAGIDFAGKADQMFKDMSASADAASTAQAKHKQSIEDATAAIEAQAEAEQKLTDQQKKVVDDAKKAADEQARATAEMYKEAGLGADKYFKAESTKLVEKAASWQAAGADQLAVEQWLYDELGKLSEEAWGKQEAAASLYLDGMQAQIGTLVDEFNILRPTSEEVIDAITGKANSLDGTDIGLSVSFDGTAAYQGIDALIARLGSLQAAAVAAPSGGQQTTPGYNPNETTAEFAERTDNTGASIVNNFNQQLNRSDITAIVAEQARRGARS